MAYRLRINNLTGSLGADLAAADTTVTLAAPLPSAAVPVSGTSVLAVVVEPGTANEEIINITGPATTGATYPCSRGLEGTSAILHASGLSWIHAPTVLDYLTSRGAWAASTAYSVGDVFTNGGNTYHVTTAYTSGTTFGSTDTTNAEVWAAVGATGGTGPTGATGPGGVTFEMPGTLATVTGVNRWYNDTGRTLNMKKVRASVGTAPTGTTTVDVKRNGTSVFLTPGLTIPVSANTATKVADAGGTAAVAQTTTTGTFPVAPATNNVLIAAVVAGSQPALPTGIGTWAWVPGAAATAEATGAWLAYCLNPNGVSSAVSGTGVAYVWEIGGVTQAIPAGGAGSGGFVNNGPINQAQTLGVGDIALWVAETNAAGATLSGAATADATGTVGLKWAVAHYVAAAAGSQTESASMSGFNDLAIVGCHLVAKAASMNDGDYLTADITAADGTAANLTVQIALS